MIKISATFDDSGARKLLQNLQKQVEFAKLRALSNVARQAAVDTKAALPTVLKSPVPFTVSSIRWKGASKVKPSSVVYLAPVAAKYLLPLIEGSEARPTKGKALILAGADPLNQYGNVPRRRVKQLLAKKNTFSGTVQGIGGIWERQGGKLKLLLRYADKQQKRKQFDFEGIVRKSVSRHWPRLFKQALADAMRTAR